MASSGLKKKRSLSEKLHFLSIRALGKTIKCIDRFMGTSLFHEKFSPRFGSTDYKNVQGVMREIFVKSVNEDISPFLKSIKAPTLILWGANDTETPPEMAVRLNSSISHSKMFLFPYKGHYLHEDSGSHLCTSYVEAFLKEGKKHVSF
jgi:pimeloyl-ACP methyl ester carboxylesterase